jgi:hypothetical protein
MEDKKIPSRGFQNVEHFFLSGSSKDMESIAADAATGNNVDADHSGGLAKTGPASLNETEQHRMNSAKLDSVQSSLDGDKTLYPQKGDIDTSSNSPHTRKKVDVLDRGSQHRRANDCIGGTVAKLEVLKRSCRGVALQAEGTKANNVWFQGAAAIIQEAISTLSEVLNLSENNDS